MDKKEMDELMSDVNDYTKNNSSNEEHKHFFNEMVEETNIKFNNEYATGKKRAESDLQNDNGTTFNFTSSNDIPKEAMSDLQDSLSDYFDDGKKDAIKELNDYDNVLDFNSFTPFAQHKELENKKSIISDTKGLNKSLDKLFFGEETIENKKETKEKLDETSISEATEIFKEFSEKVLDISFKTLSYNKLNIEIKQKEKIDILVNEYKKISDKLNESVKLFSLLSKSENYIPSYFDFLNNTLKGYMETLQVLVYITFSNSVNLVTSDNFLIKVRIISNSIIESFDNANKDIIKFFEDSIKLKQNEIKATKL